ncbi:hypothetical protein ACROYT_G044772 [Oculina patagonica]
MKYGQQQNSLQEKTMGNIVRPFSSSSHLGSWNDVICGVDERTIHVAGLVDKNTEQIVSHEQKLYFKEAYRNGQPTPAFVQAARELCVQQAESKFQKSASEWKNDAQSAEQFAGEDDGQYSASVFFILSPGRLE